MKTHILTLMAWPFLVAAAFHYTDWLGWPTLVVGVLFGVVSLCAVLGGIGLFWAKEMKQTAEEALDITRLAEQKQKDLRDWAARQ